MPLPAEQRRVLAHLYTPGGDSKLNRLSGVNYYDIHDPKNAQGRDNNSPSKDIKFSLSRSDSSRGRWWRASARATLPERRIAL